MLVEFMADKQEATVKEVAEYVHEHGDTAENTIRKNVQRTSESLAKMGSSLLFRMVSGRVFREINL